ncbi:MAG: hypothetical protein ACRYG8_44745 [Janthinobacterium lividum]
MPRPLSIWQATRKRKPHQPPKVKDRRPDGDRLRDREQRIERVRQIELQAEREAFLGHERNAERLSHHAAEMRDAAP